MASILSSFSDFVLLWLLGFRQAAAEDVGRRPAVHIAALVRPQGVVSDQVSVEVGLHLGDALVELGSAQDAEVLVEEGPVKALDEAVGLGSADLGGAVLDVLELEEQYALKGRES